MPYDYSQHFRWPPSNRSQPKTEAPSNYRLRSTNRGRRAFTLVELLVVIAIIGILVALLLPAVQSAREAARRTQCQTNMKNLALACLNYHDSRKQMPPGIKIPDNVSSAFNRFQSIRGTGNTQFANWAVYILPLIEEQPLFDQIIWEHPTTGNAIGLNRAQNRQVHSAELGIYLCPTDRGNEVKCTVGSSEWARGNYGLNMTGQLPEDIDPVDKPNWKQNAFEPGALGVSLVDRGLRIAQITDGTSKTICLAEMRVGLSPSDRRGSWALSTGGGNLHVRHYTNCTQGPNGCEGGEDDIYQHGAVISEVGAEALRSECMLPDTSWEAMGQSTVRSAHTGGVFVAMVDGSVHFLTNDIDVGDIDPDGPGCAGIYLSNIQFGVWERLNSSNDELPTAEF